MQANERQYERVARWLDGERLELTPEEHALAEEIRRNERSLARDLPAEAPPAAMQRAERRLHAATAARPRPWKWIGAGAAVAAGVVALILAIGLFGGDDTPVARKPRNAAEPGGPTVAQQVDAAEQDFAALEDVVAEDEYDAISEEIAAASEMAWAEEADAIEQQIDALEDRMNGRETNGIDGGRPDES